jgi:hypothetical protein
MKHVRSAIDIGAPGDAVWTIITDFDRWPEWGPTVRAVIASASSVAAGVTGKVQTPVGIWLPFQITEVDAGRSWGWDVAGIAATGHEVIATGPASCRLEFSVPWPAAPYVAVLRPGLRRVKRLAEMPASSLPSTN